MPHSHALDFLPSLPELRELGMADTVVPACLSRLTTLTALSLETMAVDPLEVPIGWEAEDEEEGGPPMQPQEARIQELLAPLRGLRRLTLRAVQGVWRVPRAARSLPWLQYLEWRST